jgi:hypothetical protein
LRKLTLASPRSAPAHQHNAQTSVGVLRQFPHRRRNRFFHVAQSRLIPTFSHPSTASSQPHPRAHAIHVCAIG